MSPLLATIVLHHLDWRLEALGSRCGRDADDGVVLGKTTCQAEKALEAVTACGEEDLGLALNPAKTQVTTCGPGVAFLGYAVSARTIRMGGQAEARCKTKSKAWPKRRHHLDAEVGRHINRVICGTVRYCATACTTCLGQCNALDRGIRMRIRGMQDKRIGTTDNRRVKRRHIRRMGFVLGREVYVRAREGEDTDSSQGALSWGPPGVRKTHAGKEGALTPWRQRGGAGYGLPLTHWLMGVPHEEATGDPGFCSRSRSSVAFRHRAVYNACTVG
jgi:hypothetical protein